LSALFAIALSIGARGVASHRTPGKLLAATAPENVSLERNRMEAHIRVLLESYRASVGSYPPSLQSLADAGLAPRSLLQRADNLAIRYYLTPYQDTYTLL
jgi:hypothetical protein